MTVQRHQAELLVMPPGEVADTRTSMARMVSKLSGVSGALRNFDIELPLLMASIRLTMSSEVSTRLAQIVVGRRDAAVATRLTSNRHAIAVMRSAADMRNSAMTRHRIGATRNALLRGMPAGARSTARVNPSLTISGGISFLASAFDGLSFGLFTRRSHAPTPWRKPRLPPSERGLARAERVAATTAASTTPATWMKMVARFPEEAIAALKA